MIEKKRLGDILIERKVISTSQLEEALKKQKELKLPLGETLIRLKFVNEHLLLDTLSKHLEIDFLNISEGDFQIVDKSLIKVLPLQVCQRLNVLPIFQLIDGDIRELSVAMSDPLADQGIKEIEEITQCHVTPILSTSLSIRGGINKLFDIKADAVKESIDIDKGDAVAMVNKILLDAVSSGASDIHIEPHFKEVHVRTRIDGVLQLAATIPSVNLPYIVSRIKIMASEKNSNMRIEEKRLPQDGAFARIVGGHAIDCRVSTIPTIFGEKVVIRVFDKDKATHVGRISDLLMAPRMDLEFRRAVRQSSGIIIITGPTGSGKTSTLNAIVNEINDVGINIITIEDPVEYNAPDYVNQSSLNVHAGYTYGRAMRAMMRQDPDVILIGEVRDLDTAQFAVQAALTGHQVFTTLHTDDAASAVVRMVDIGVEQFLVSSTLVSALNQRLMRKICPNCIEDYVPARIEMTDVGIDPEVVDEILSSPEKFKLRRGRGCPRCRNTGYSGRQGVFEIITVTPAVRDMILRRENSDAISAKSREVNKVNLIFEEGLRLVLTGVTTVGEMHLLSRGDYKMKSVAEIFRDAEIQM